MNTPYLTEILEQPEAIRRSIENYPLYQSDLAGLAEAIQDHQFRQIILTGMGSSLHSCYPLWLSLNARTSTPALLWDASELVHYAPEVLTPHTLLVAVSQSGESIELKALTQLKNRPGRSISITNGLENSLARWADLPLNTHAGAEATVSTKTYVTGLAVLALLDSQLTGQGTGARQDKLYQAAAGLGDFLTDWQSNLAVMADFLGPCETLAYIGRGPSMASVQTAALITKEASKVFCLGLSAGQFRHGPLELVRPGFNAVIFAGSETTRGLNEKLAGEIAGYGGQSLLITPQPQAGPVTPGVLELSLPAAEPDLLPLLEIVPIQLLTIPLAEARGFEPATFSHASKVTTME